MLNTTSAPSWVSFTLAVDFPSSVVKVTVAVRDAVAVFSAALMPMLASPLPLVAPSVTQDSAQFAVQSAFAVTLTDLVSAVAEKESSEGDTDSKVPAAS